jgi:hypothetical protein
MTIKDDILKDLELLAERLGALLEDIVFVGGSTICLYVNNARQNELRPTIDRDAIVNTKDYSEFHAFEMNVQKLGFERDTKDRINCTWRFETIVVDFMPGNQIAGYINNKWYQAAMEHAEKLELNSGKTVKIISPIYLMATKLEAFHSRGKLKIPEIFDGEANKDLEDIVHLIEGRDVLLSELKRAPLSVQAYVKSQLNKIIANPLSEDFINNCFGGALGSKRAQYVKDQISKIILQS